MAIDAERLRTQCVYEIEAPLQTIVADMDEIAKAAAKWKAFRTTLRWICGGLLAFGILSLISGYWYIGLPGIAIAIYGFVYAYRYARDVVARAKRCETVKSLATLLASDTSPKADATVKLAFKEVRHLLHDEAFPLRRDGRQSFFTDSWLTLEVQLLDGVEYQQTLTDLIRERTFKNPRGKRKTKIRTHHSVGLRLTYPPEVYGDLRNSGAKLSQPVLLPPSAVLKSKKVTESDIKLKATVRISAELTRTCSMMALGAYRILNFGRKVSSRRSAS